MPDKLFLFTVVVGGDETQCDVACTANFNSSRRLCWGPGPNLCQQSKHTLSLIRYVTYRPYTDHFSASALGRFRVRVSVWLSGW